MNQYQPLINEFVFLLQEALGGEIVSIVLYGSVARGTARAESDVDLLLILKEAPADYKTRLKPVLSILKELRQRSCWRELEERGLKPFVSVLALSYEEANENRYLYLDMIDEGQILMDRDGFFQAKLESLRQRLRELGARKVKRNGDWYWDLKPDLKAGEIIVL